MARLFISYARADARELALNLRSALATSHTAWLDTREIAGGASWSIAIEQSIDECDVLLALLSPAAHRSPICRGEHLRALRMGKRVIPVLATPNADRPIYFEAANYRDLSSRDGLAAGLAGLSADLETWQQLKPTAAWQAAPVRRPAPPPSILHLIRRDDVVAELRDLVLHESSHSSIGVTALQGLPGGGKTSLAVQLCSDERLRDAFPDGVVWVTLGPGTDPRGHIGTIIEAVGETAFAPDRVELDLRVALQQKAAFIVLDDVWQLGQVQPFIVDSPRSRILITTRFPTISAELGARVLRVPDLSEPQAIQMLETWSQRSVEPLFVAVARRVHCVPLALKIAGAQLRQPASIDLWLSSFENVSQLASSTAGRGDRERDVGACIDLSLETLDAAGRELFDALAVFTPDTAIPRALIRSFWKRVRPSGDAHALARVEELSLLEPRSATELQMHGLVVDHARSRLTASDRSARDLHELVLEAFNPHNGAWSELTVDAGIENYFHAQLTRHLQEARGSAGLSRLLAEVDARGSNGWHRRRSERRETAQYIADVRLASSASVDERPNAEFIRPEEIRSALILASLRTRTANAPPTLVRAFVEQKLWSVQRARDYAAELPHAEDRLDVLMEVAQAATGPAQSTLLEDAARALPAIEDRSVRSWKGDKLVGALHGAGKTVRAIELALQRTGDRFLSNALAVVVPGADDWEGQDAFLRALATLRDQDSHIYVFASFAAAVHQRRPEFVPAAAREIEKLSSALDRAVASEPLLPLLDETTRQRRLEDAIQVLQTGGIEMIEAVTPYLTRRRLLDLADELLRRTYFPVQHRARAIEVVAARLRQPDRRVFIDCLLFRTIAERHADATPWPDEAATDEVATAADSDLDDRRISEPGAERARLGEIVAACARLEPERATLLLRAGLAAVAFSDGDWSFATNLTALVAELPPSMLGEAIDATSTISEEHRATPLAAIAKRCKGADQARALAAAIRKFKPGAARCGLLAAIAAELPESERRRELREVATEVIGRSYDVEAELSLLPHADSLERPDEFLDGLWVRVTHGKHRAAHLAQFCKRLPANRVEDWLGLALNLADVELRRTALGALAPRLSRHALATTALRLDEIQDERARTEGRSTLTALAQEEPHLSAQRRDLEILERLSAELGEWGDDASQWSQVDIGRVLCDDGQVDTALVVLSRVNERHARARLLEEIVNRDASERVGKSIGGKKNEAHLRLRCVERLERVAARENYLREQEPLTQLGRARFRAECAPSIADDRAEVIDQFLSLIPNDDEPGEWIVQTIRKVAPYLTSAQLSRCAKIVDDSRGDERSRAQFALAARDPSRLGRALHGLTYIDKPFRVPILCAAFELFSETEDRAALAKEALSYAKTQYHEPDVSDLCVASRLLQGSDQREALERALDAAARSASSSRLKLVGARLCLVPRHVALDVWSSGLLSASTLFREHVLRQIVSLRLALLRLGRPAEFMAIEKAIDDVGRWWP